jgi:tetratricopeptide (TPR) repeat protein
VLALVGLAGVAVYGVVTVARGTPSAAQGKPAPGAAGPTASDALRQVDPLITAGEWSKAIAVLTPAIEAHPEEQELRLALARVYSGQKEWKKSSDAYETALTLGAESAPLHAEAGTVANAAGLLDLSIEHYSRAQSLDPKNPIHPLYLGMVQIKAGNEREAMANLYTATVLNPDLAEAWGVMGELELRANHLDLALQHLEKARKIQPASLKWRLAEAKVHKRQNEPGKALDLLINLPEKERYSADTIPVVMDALAMLKQPERRAEYLEAAKSCARAARDERALAEIGKYAQQQP